MKTKLKIWHWHIIAVAFFLLLTVIYFAPVVFEGKDLVQADITSGQGWGKDLADYHKETGEYAFWSNAMFGGMPANYAYMPPTVNVFSYLSSIFLFGLSGLHLGLVFIYLLGFYIFLLSIGCKPWLSIIGAIAYTFASYNFIIIEAGHVSKGLVMATMAPILGGIILTYRKKYLLGALVTLVFTGINIVFNHQQITYYVLMMIAVLAVVYLIYAIKEHTVKDFFKSSAILVVAGTLAALPAVGHLIPTMDYTKETMRGGAVLQQNEDEGGKKNAGSGLDIGYAFQWSYGVGETMTLLIPNFYGASSHYNVGTDSKIYSALRSSGQGAQVARHAPTYWGDQPFTSGPVYAGAIVCFLFVLGLFLVKGPEKWWLLLATILSVMLSWGRHFAVFNDFLFYHLPLYSKFRTPSMALVIAGVTMAALAVLTLKEIVESKGKKDFLLNFKQPLYTSVGITGGLCLLFALLGGSFFDFSGSADLNYPDWFVAALRTDRQDLLRADAWRSLVFIALAAGLIWGFVKSKIQATHLLLGVGLLILVDMWGVDKRFLNNDNFVPKKQAKAILPTEADEQILQDKDPNYRVLNLTTSTFNESSTSYFHKSVGGYSPAKLRRYQDIIDYHLSSQINMNVVNMLNTRYFILRSEQGPRVQRNPDAMGNCWFVDTLRWVNNPNEEIVALNDFDPKTTAIVDVAWKETLPNALPNNSESAAASIEMTDYMPGNIVYASSNAQQQLAVFSEVFYKTWKAYVDGNEVPLVRVNYILRALPVPAGEHRIEFKCVDEVFIKSAKLSLWTSVLVGAILVALVGWLFYQYRKAQAKVAQKAVKA